MAREMTRLCDDRKLSCFIDWKALARVRKKLGMSDLSSDAGEIGRNKLYTGLKARRARYTSLRKVRESKIWTLNSAEWKLENRFGPSDTEHIQRRLTRANNATHVMTIGCQDSKRCNTIIVNNMWISGMHTGDQSVNKSIA
jgi:hypothetical protein